MMFREQLKIRGAAMAAIVIMIIFAMARCSTESRPVSEQTPGDDEQVSPPSVSRRVVSGTARQPQGVNQGIPVAVEPGRVTVMLSASTYDKGELIAGTIANGLEQSIFAEDMKTDCSIVILEHWDNPLWRPLLSCAMERLAFIVEIKAGRTEDVTINPRSTHFEVIAGEGEHPLGGGKYRLKFTYRLSPGPEGVEPEAAYSGTFAILDGQAR